MIRLSTTVPIELNTARLNPPTTNNVRKLVFLEMLFSPFLKLSLGNSAEALGGIGGFSRKNTKRGTDSTVVMIASTKRSFKNNSFPFV